VNESEVNEELETPKVEKLLPELTVEIPAEETLGSHAPGPSWLRLAYTFEFLIALMAILSLWSEIGGQGHLDLMPWYTKLICILGLAWCCVRFTAAIVEQQKVWTYRSVSWFAGVLLCCAVIGGITYYYHLHEESDQGDEDTTASAVSIANPGTIFDDASTTKNR
jgi:hypothetical protein